MQRYASKVSEGMALQLGCLELRYVAFGPLHGGGYASPPVLDSWPADFPPGSEVRVDM